MKKLQDGTQRIPAHAQCWTGQQGRDQPTCGILCDLLLLGFLGVPQGSKAPTSALFTCRIRNSMIGMCRNRLACKNALRQFQVSRGNLSAGGMRDVNQARILWLRSQWPWSLDLSSTLPTAGVPLREPQTAERRTWQRERYGIEFRV